MTTYRRDYDAIVRHVRRVGFPLGTRADSLARLTDILWEELSGQGVAWLGFYELSPKGDSMLLVACRPRPACSPIGLHGVCGRAHLERRSQVVEDVHALGGDHIVCDPANLSEVVVPLLDPGGACSTVLDLDSRQPAAFTGLDAEGLARVLRVAGLSR